MTNAPAGIDIVFELGLELPGVVESTYYGARALKLKRRMLVCVAVNKSAETGSVVMAIDLAQRAALLQAHPEHFYLTEHYSPHPMLLMRPAKISRAELQRVLRLAWAFVSSELASKDLVPRV